MNIAEKIADPIMEAFGPEGYISKLQPGYEPRVGQVELAYSVLEGMQEGHHVIVEAPTGTGKSFGYGVPATLMASRGEKVVIVTANIALQEQLVGKDLPALEQALPWKFTFALAKGIGNYLCLDAFEDTSNETILTGWEGSRDEREKWNQIVRWSSETATGDISELPFELTPKLRPKLTVLAEDCPAGKCSYYGDCHAMRARNKFKHAQVVVTNYSMFYIDLSLKAGGSKGVLPAYTHVIFDEGHQAAEQARGFMGFRITSGGIAYAIKLLDYKQPDSAKKGALPVIDEALKRRTTVAADGMFGALQQLFHSHQYSIRFREPWSGTLVKQAAQLSTLLSSCADQFIAASGLPLKPERIIELQRAASKCGEHASNIQRVANAANDGWVYYMDEENERIALKGMPVDVSGFLRESLFEREDKECPVKSVCVTSATLATKVDDFKYTKKRLGLRNAEELSVESPFDIEANTLLVLPAMPSPSSPRFVASAAERIMDIADESKGRMLCLFTSYRVMNAVHEELSKGFPYPLLKQGEAPRLQLIRRFTEDVSSVLLGTESFWAGVDVPGESLSVVVIDKLPFPNISDPVQDALREQRGRAYFGEYSVPEAVIKFRQGCGRLLRRATDRGVVVVLDSRVREKSYGVSFTRSFPKGVRTVRELGVIGDFLNRE